MPAGLAFLNVKSWHPATYVSPCCLDRNGVALTSRGYHTRPRTHTHRPHQRQENQKKIWIAEQKAKEKEKREKEAAAQLSKEMEA